MIFALGSEAEVDFSACDSVLKEAKDFYANLSDIQIEGYSDEAVLSRWLPYQTFCAKYSAGKGIQGAAFKYYKFLIGEFMGVRLDGNKIWVAPRLPESVKELKFTYAKHGRKYNFIIDNNKKTGEWRYKIGRLMYSGNGLDLTESLAEKEIRVLRVT